jgi:uncharacterized membrane protein
MTYDFHPIFVHFPIAFLTLYSIIKILPLTRWFPRVAWRDIERVLLVFGFIGSIAALLTGEQAEELNRPPQDIAEWHEFFANTTIWLYGALLAGEFLSFIRRFFSQSLGTIGAKWPSVIKTFRFLENLLTHNLFSKLIAVVALGTLFLTGLLGGVMVYGTTADPLAPFVLKILGIDLW